MNDPLLPEGIRVPAKRGTEATRDRHLSTSGERHERWLSRWSVVRTPVAIIAGIIWAELSWLVGFRVWQLIVTVGSGDEITVAGIFAAWLALTTGIFRVLRPPTSPSTRRRGESAGSESPGRTTHHSPAVSGLDGELAQTLAEVGRADEPVSAAEISRRLGVSPLRATYRLDKLERAGLVVEEYVDDYSLTADGRAYIVEHNLDR